MTDPAPLPPLLATENDWVEYAIGDPYHQGRTTVVVEGDGRALVRHQEGEREDAYRGDLSAEQLAPLLTVLRAHDPRALVSGRTLGVAGEARVRFATQTDGVMVVVELWDDERREIPAMKALVEAFNRVATAVSVGKVRY